MTTVIENNKGVGREIMGVPKEQAARNRQAIIDTASRMFRERGVDGIGLADLMKAAGFTHGGFYNHFRSKDDLAAAACTAAFAAGASSLEQLGGAEGDQDAVLRAFMERYLSAEHCDAPGSGCPTATLAVDAARQGKEMQVAYAAGIEGFLQAIAPHLAGGNRDSRADAIAMLASLIGTIVLARGVGGADPTLCAEILEAGRKHLAE